MLEQIFSANPPADRFEQAASQVDGAASVIVGIAANRSMDTGQLVHINELFPLAKYTSAFMGLVATVAVELAKVKR